MHEIDFSPLDTYAPLFYEERRPGIVIAMSGRGTGKSINIGGRLPLKHVLIDNARGVVLRDEQVKIKQSVFNDIRNTYSLIDEQFDGQLSEYYEMQEKALKDRKTNEDLIFQAGFKSSSNDKSANQKGFSNVQFAIMEEAEDFRDEEKFFKFRDSISRFNATIYILLNTPDVGHWIVKRFFDLENTEFEGYYKPIPKNIKNVQYYLCDYRDNYYLNEQTVKDFESYGDINSPFYNQEYYLNQILGYVTTGRKGLVYPEFNLIDKFPEEIEFIRYGLDFGYANDPTAFIKVGKYKNELFLEEKLYKTNLTNPQICQELKQLGLTNEMIIADSAEPKSIEEIYQEGFNIHPAIKGKDSLLNGIDNVKRYQLNVVKDSINLITELRNYTWDTDKNKEIINKPIDKYNHLLDSLRYSLSKEDEGIYVL